MEGRMKLQKKRLLELATYLETTVHPYNFDMKVWHKKSPSCGTTACALGHACMIPRFKRLGLRLKESDSWSSLSSPSYKENEGLKAAEKFFGLTSNEAERLFREGPENETPGAWAFGIRQFVKSRRVEHDRL
jgi:hypothetical protein